jgi:hypothetical protein
MSHISNQRVYVLTARDVERIRGLLQSVNEAVAEILDYRGVRSIDPEADFPMEDFVYQQTSQIVRQCELPLDGPF